MQHQQPVRPLLDLPPRFTLGARAARHHPADRAAQNGRQRAMDARVPLEERWMHECRSNWHGGDHTVVDAASTPSSTAGDTCIFQSCPRLFRGHVHTLGAWAPEFGLYAHRPQTCVIVRSDRSAGCHGRARRTPMFETWVTGSRELAMPSRRAASTRHF